MKKKINCPLKNLIAVFGIITLIGCGNSEKKVDCAADEVPTYNKNITQIIENKCFKCHAKEVYKNKASRNKIYDYKSLKKMGESGFLIGAITHQKGFIPMPYKAGKKIDDCSIAMISKWVSTGMKE